VLEVVAEAYIVAFVHFAESHACLKKCDNHKKKEDTLHNLDASWPGRILLYLKYSKRIIVLQSTFHIHKNLMRYEMNKMTNLHSE